MYNNRIEVDKKQEGYDESKTRYDEYRLNKNMLLAQRELFLKKQEIKQIVDNYEDITKKSKINGVVEKALFNEESKKIKAEYEIRDNKKLISSAKEIRKYKHNFKKKKMLLLPVVDETKIDKETFEEKRKRFMDNAKEEVKPINIEISEDERNTQLEHEEIK